MNKPLDPMNPVCVRVDDDGFVRHARLAEEDAVSRTQRVPYLLTGSCRSSVRPVYCLRMYLPCRCYMADAFQITTLCCALSLPVKGLASWLQNHYATRHYTLRTTDAGSGLHATDGGRVISTSPSAAYHDDVPPPPEHRAARQ